MKIHINGGNINSSHFPNEHYVLTDDLIKTKVSQTAGSKIMGFALPLFLGGFGLAMVSSMFGLDWLFMLVFPCLFVGIPGLIIASLVASNNAKKNMTSSDWSGSRLFLSEFVGTRRHHKSKGGDSYYLVFLDETGTQQRQRVNYSVYREFKDNCNQGDVIVLLKYPKYRQEGYDYHMFDAANFRNESSIPNPSELDDFYRQREQNNDYPQYNNPPRKVWDSEANNEDW